MTFPEALGALLYAFLVVGFSAAVTDLVVRIRRLRPKAKRRKK